MANTTVIPTTILATPEDNRDNPNSLRSVTPQSSEIQAN
jgi:hypothetical protein